jgi:hypothetical protein
MTTNKKLVMVSSVIHGVRKTKFVFIDPLPDGKIRIQPETLPGVSDLPDGVTYSWG